MQRKRNLRLYIEAVGVLTLLTLGLFTLRIIMTGTLRYWFIPENLALAWLGFGLAWLLKQRLAVSRWLSWPNIGLSLLWLIFLPNTWYVMTDFIHVYQTGEINEIYDIMLITSLIFCGFALGLTSLYLVHRELRSRLGALRSYALIEVTLLLSGFAIYLGRDLRWSTWDVLTNPSGLILSISDRIISPFAHRSVLDITGLMFVSLSVVYFAFWRGLQIMRRF